MSLLTPDDWTAVALSLRVAAVATAAGLPVALLTALGQTIARARLNPRLRPGVVCAQYGWWPENLNALIPGDDADPVSGSNRLKSAACEIRKA